MKFLRRLLGQRPVILLLIDLVQDLDLIAPIAAGIARRPDLGLKVIATERVLKKSPRIQATFEFMNIPLYLANHKAVLKGRSPSLSGISAVIAAAETTAGPHRVAHALAQRANKMGLATYTMQHGYENIGLTYSDQTYSYEDIRFASQRVFIWGELAQLPAAVATETKQKCISVGCPKFVQPLQALPAIEHGGLHIISIFENLHWERYSDRYRQQALHDIEATAKAFPDVTFLLKPHPAGLWLTHQAQNRLPQASNLYVVDPEVEKWQPYSAPAFLAISDGAISTPSTVILDAARLETPIATVGYDLELPDYQPLPCLTSTADWAAFVGAICEGSALARDLLSLNQEFLTKHVRPGDAVSRILDRVSLDVTR